METKPNILIFDGSRIHAGKLHEELQNSGMNFKSMQVNTRKQFTKQLAAFSPDVVLVADNVPDFEGMTALKYVKNFYPDLPVILILDSSSRHQAKAILDGGASDYITNSEFYRLAPSVWRAKHESRSRKLQKRIEEERKFFLFQLGNQIAELTVLNQISDILRSADTSLPEVFQKIVSIIPQGWRYPQVTAARIVFDGRTYGTTNYRETLWRQYSKFFVNQVPGLLEVVYLEEMPDEFEGPFLSEERTLLNMIVDMLKSFLERRQTRKALQQSEKKYSMLVENSLTGIYINLNGRIVFLNNQFAEIHGYTRDELVETEFRNLIHPDDRSRVEKMNKPRENGDDTFPEVEIRGVKKDNRVIWVNINHSLIEFNGKKALLGNLIDITRRKQMEEALQHSHSELRYLSSQLLKAHEDERKKIARDLHDTIAQNLLAIKVFLEDKARTLQRMEVGADVSLDDLIRMTVSSIHDLRRIMGNLRPAVLDDLGLLAAINWQCEEFCRIYPDICIKKQLDLTEQQVPAGLKVVVYRILQEAMSNVARHSRADTVYLNFRRTGDWFEMVIRDNGIGFDSQKKLHGNESAGKFGLIGMKERSELSNGSFRLESCPGKGTIVKVAWNCGG